MFQHVMNRHDVRARQRSRHREEIGDVDQVAVELLQSRAKLPVAFHGPLRFDEGNGVKVRREGANFLDLFRWPDQKILASVVEAAQRPYHVADVSPHAKLSHPPDVDSDLHGRHLTTEGTGEHRGINSRITWPSSASFGH